MSYMEEKKSLLTWVKEHKTELIILGVTAVGTILVIKNWDSIKGIFKSSNSISTPTVNIKPILEEVVIPVLPSDIIDNLTGNKLTATELGNKVWCSAQAINKRIVAAGLATKLPCGDYSLTEAGRLLGEHTWKTTWAGHPFSNIEWDEKILEIIFKAEELLEIANKQKIAHEILSGSAA
jgi:hypothetical protein